MSSTPPADRVDRGPGPGWMHGGFMQVFVRAFRDGNGDGIGDLRGLTDALPYLADLGVRGLWLMPIHPSQDGDHGYAVTDYRGVAPDYGTLADLDALLVAAHALGIGVILDYVINHCAAAHPLFADARSDRGSAHRDWFLWADRHPEGWSIYGRDPWHRDASGWYFGAFSSRMPDFDWRNPAVEAWHLENLRFWLDRGVDGFRLDACGHLVENGPEAWDCQPENLDILARVHAFVHRWPDRYLVCEAPGDPQSYARHAGSAFAFDLNGALLDAAEGDADAVAHARDYFARAPSGMATMLSNHDSFAGARVHDRLGGDLARTRLAAGAYLLMPGHPFVYYGEEVGMSAAAGLQGDAALRAPMSWTADPRTAGFSAAPPFRRPARNVRSHNVAQATRDAASLHAFYRLLLGWRRARPSLARGDYEPLALPGPAWGFVRRLGDERTLVLLNPGDAALVVDAPGRARPLGGAAAATGDARSVAVPACGLGVFALDSR